MSKLNADLFRQVCDEVSQGATLADVCRKLKINRLDFWHTCEASEDNKRSYARAREMQAESWADEMMSDDEIDPQIARLNFDKRKWLMSKNHVGRYGDKIEQRVTGADGGPLEVVWVKPKKSNGAES